MSEPVMVAVLPAIRVARMRLELTMAQRAGELATAAEHASGGWGVQAIVEELERLADAHGELLNLEDRLRARGMAEEVPT